MWELLTEENRNKLVVGAILLKYPLAGDPVHEVPLHYDPIEGQEYQIQLVDQEIHHIEIAFPPLPAAAIGGLNFAIGNVHKYAEDLIEQQIWWIYKIMSK